MRCPPTGRNFRARRSRCAQILLDGLRSKCRGANAGIRPLLCWSGATAHLRSVAAWAKPLAISLSCAWAWRTACSTAVDTGYPKSDRRWLHAEQMTLRIALAAIRWMNGCGISYRQRNEASEEESKHRTKPGIRRSHGACSKTRLLDHSFPSLGRSYDRDAWMSIAGSLRRAYDELTTDAVGNPSSDPSQSRVSTHRRVQLSGATPERWEAIANVRGLQ